MCRDRMTSMTLATPLRSAGVSASPIGPCAQRRVWAQPRLGARLVVAAVLSGLAMTTAYATGVPASKGRWRSATETLPIATAFEESVWGKGAQKLRDVELSFTSQGDATLTVTRRVIDARGRTVPGSTTVEFAEVTLGDVARENEYRADRNLVVRRAERRYPDDPEATWALEGLRITLSTFPDDADAMEVRIDYPEGRNSFWETLRPATSSTGRSKRATSRT